MKPSLDPLDPPAPQIIRSIAELLAWRKSIHVPISFVPTMGALHAGHAALLREARKRCPISVLSIFVNPTQFAPHEDLSKYPRTFESDVKLATREGVHLIFAPAPEELYPANYSTYVSEQALSIPLCGAFRPTHFQGVTTIVLKLFQLVRPDRAFFGLKDAQQFFVIEKMVRDLHLQVTVEGIPTVRESDGLAMSSRNAYLTTTQRTQAPLLYRGLQEISEHIKKKALSPIELERLLHSFKELFEKQGFGVQYLECLTLPQLTKPTGFAQLPLLVAVAATLGTTRLIDNLILSSAADP